MSQRLCYLEALESAIQLKHKCTPVHKETVFVHEKTRNDETVWKGDVEIFDLKGHTIANICYAWQDLHHGDGKIFTILATKVIDSPARAVQAAIFVGQERPHSQGRSCIAG